MAFKPLWEGQKCSLGYELLDWIQEYECHGPGDVMGKPLDLASDPEVEEFIIGAYELDPETGRRKIRRGVYSAPKGRAKSETAGLIGVAEGLGPVRFDGWDGNGQPVGRPVTSPFIRCLATEEKQAGNTFQNIAFIMGEWGPDVHPDIYGGITGVRDYRRATALSLPDGGEAVLSTAGAASKDGGKETFLVPDEVHLYITAELRDMYATALRNTGKRKHAEPWALLTTTACRLGEQSVWEVLHKLYVQGKLGPDWLVHHREAKGRIDINDRERTLKQLRDVYGVAMDPEVGWMLAEDVYSDMHDPTVCRDEAEAARYFLNRSMAGSDAWIALAVHERQTRPRKDANGKPVEPEQWEIVPNAKPRKLPIALGFDGSLNEDTTVLRGCRMSDGHLFKLGSWAKPLGVAGAGWEVPRSEVLTAIRQAHKDFDVVMGFYDPHEWRSDIETLALELGEKRVIPFETRSDTRMGPALDRLHSGLTVGEVTHDDDPEAAEHYGNAYVVHRRGQRLVRKDNPNSARKIDSVVGDALALAARAKALADGWVEKTKPAPPPLVFGM